MTLWEFLNSKFGLLVIGFLLTTVLGALFSTWLQKLIWKRQTLLDLYKARFEQGTEFLDELSEKIGKRFYRTQKLLWAFKEKKTDISGEEHLYFEVVSEWNTVLRVYRNKIRLLIGELYANKFLDYSDDHRPDTPQSVHYKFVKVGKIVTTIREEKHDIEKVQKEVDELNWQCSTFVEEITTEFLKRSANLQLLKLDKG